MPDIPLSQKCNYWPCRLHVKLWKRMVLGSGILVETRTNTSTMYWYHEQVRTESFEPVLQRDWNNHSLGQKVVQGSLKSDCLGADIGWLGRKKLWGEIETILYPFETNEPMRHLWPRGMKTVTDAPPLFRVRVSLHCEEGFGVDLLDFVSQVLC